MVETGISFSHTLNSGLPSLIQDIVLVRRNADGTELLSFSLGELAKDAQIVFKEVVLPGQVGMNGQGIYKITGELSLYQNDYATLNNYQSLVGRLFEIHVLYMTGEYRASDFVSAGKLQNVTSNRFNNVSAYRSQFGVYLSLTDSSDNYETVTLTVDGATALKVNKNITASDFYGRFKNLNKTALNDSARVTTGGLSGS